MSGTLSYEEVVLRNVDKAATHVLTAPDYHLRATLLSLCDDVRTRRRLVKRLESLREHDQPATALRRKVLKDLWLCVQCHATFSHEDNKDDNCLHHPGKIELDETSEEWADTDEGMMPDSDDEEVMEEFPDGYQWTCCEGRYNAQPCQIGKHTEHPNQKGNGELVSHHKRQRSESEYGARKERKV